MSDWIPDEALAVRAKEGNISAFEELFNRYKKPILNFIYRMIGNRETSEEVTQEIFIKVYNNLGVFDPKRKFSTWLYTIARNLAKNSIRDRKYFRDISMETPVGGKDEPGRLKDVIADPAATPEMIAEDNELAEEAQRVLESLPLEYKDVITLCSIQGMRLKEAAQIIGCSVASVSIRLNKAKILFMKKLGIERKDIEGSDNK